MWRTRGAGGGAEGTGVWTRDSLRARQPRGSVTVGSCHLAPSRMLKPGPGAKMVACEGACFAWCVTPMPFSSSLAGALALRAVSRMSCFDCWKRSARDRMGGVELSPAVCALHASCPTLDTRPSERLVKWASWMGVTCPAHAIARRKPGAGPQTGPPVAQRRVSPAHTSCVSVNSRTAGWPCSLTPARTAPTAGCRPLAS